MNTPAIDYIPHDGSMALIDTITEVSEGYIECSVKTSGSHSFRDDNDRIPSWIGIEYMAQSIAAYAGWVDRENGKGVSVGFLLGSRNLVLHTDFFSDETIYIQASLVFRNEELGSFKCVILSQNKETVLAEAVVNVFQPQNIDQFIKEMNTK
ncbi:MAG: hypothetical protein NE327_14890 [Lentisphaeraceae bacterium]|nr:hypothetical protein [Lentisphaeraceae bacterium]